jgi:hypothetical protein
MNIKSENSLANLVKSALFFVALILIVANSLSHGATEVVLAQFVASNFKSLPVVH